MKVSFLLLICCFVFDLSWADSKKNIIECKLEPTGTSLARYDITISETELFVSYIYGSEKLFSIRRKLVSSEYKKLLLLHKQGTKVTDKIATHYCDVWVLHTKVGDKYQPAGAVGFPDKTAPELDKFVDYIIKLAAVKVELYGFS